LKIKKLQLELKKLKKWQNNAKKAKGRKIYPQIIAFDNFLFQT